MNMYIAVIHFIHWVMSSLLDKVICALNNRGQGAKDAAGKGNMKQLYDTKKMLTAGTKKEPVQLQRRRRTYLQTRMTK